MTFEFLTAGHIRFGRGTAASAVHAVSEFGQRILLVRGRSVAWADQFARQLTDAGCHVVEHLSSGEPALDAVEQGRALAQDSRVEVVVSVGGGAAIDLGKAIAALAPSDSAAITHLEGVGEGRPLTAAPLPFVAIPTTAGTGAEVTKNAVIAVPDAGRKVSLRDQRMLPDLAIVDPALTDNSPRDVTLASGLDALTQVIEPYLTPKANPLTDALCAAAIPKALNALTKLAAGEDTSARDDMCFVSLCGGMALANAGLGAVHGLAGVIGGRLGAPHGLICGRLLGPVLVENHQMLVEGGASMDRFVTLGEWVSEAWTVAREAPFEGITAQLDRWDVPRLLRWITPQTDFDTIAEEAAGASSMKANPCVLPKAALVRIMRAAV